MEIFGTLCALYLQVHMWCVMRFRNVKVIGSLDDIPSPSLVLVNHPAIIETLVIQYLLWTKAKTIADETLFPVWCHRPFKLLPIHRGENKGGAGLVFATLSKKTAVVLYPEGGRTVKGERFYYQDERRVRHIDDRVARLVQHAFKKGCPVVPVWIDYSPSPAIENVWQGLRNITRGRPMSIYVGAVMSVDDMSSGEAIARALLQVKET